WWALEDLSDVPLAFDHATVLESAVERARSKLEYTTLAATFLPEEFTITQLRGVYESVWGTTLDAGNFHRKATRTEGFLEELDRHAAPTGGRPARLYRAAGGTSLMPPLLRSGDSAPPPDDRIARRPGRRHHGRVPSRAAGACAAARRALKARATGRTTPLRSRAQEDGADRRGRRSPPP